MSDYVVTLPVACHATFIVEAECERKAIEKAKEMFELRLIDEWEVLDCVMLGKACHFPRPWEPQADLMEEESAL